MKLTLVLLRGSFCIAALSLLTSTYAAKSPGSRDDLRRLLKLPQVHFTTGASFSTEGRLKLLGSKPDPEEIAAARNNIRGGPGDGAAWLKLAEVLSRAEDGQGASEAYSNAVRLLRVQVAQRPQDGHLLALFGEALDYSGQEEEAESALRRAVRMAPGDAETWMGLAGCLNSRVLLVLLPEGKRQSPAPDPFLQIVESFAKTKPSPAQFEKAEQLQAEAFKCFDSAAALVTNNPGIFERRAGCRLAAKLVAFIKKNAAATQPDWTPFPGVIFHPDCVGDLQRACEADPENPFRLAASLYYEVFSITLQRTGGKATEEAMESMKELLSTGAPVSIRSKLNRLNEIAGSPVKAKAAAASEYLGCISVLGLKNMQAAETHFRRATTLDARRELAWDGLMVTLVEQSRYADYLAAAEARLKSRPCGRNYVLAAKACEKLKRTRQSIEYAQTGVKAAPEEFLPRLTLAAALIQESDSLSNLSQAEAHLGKAIDLAEQASREEKIDLQFTSGIFLALTGQTEQARKAFSNLIKADETNEEAKDALRILQQW